MTFEKFRKSILNGKIRIFISRYGNDQYFYVVRGKKTYCFQQSFAQSSFDGQIFRNQVFQVDSRVYTLDKFLDSRYKYKEISVEEFTVELIKLRLK